MGDEIYAGASLANDLALSQALEGMSRAPGMAIQQGLAIRDQQLKEEQAREWEMRQRRQEQRLTMDRMADASLASSGPEMAPYGGGGGAPAAAGGRGTSAKAMQLQQAQAQAQQTPLWDYALGEQADQQQYVDVQAALAAYDQQKAADAQSVQFVGDPGPEEMMTAGGGGMPQGQPAPDLWDSGLDGYITQGAGAPEGNQVWRKPMGAAAFESRGPGGTTISDPGYDVNPMVEIGESAAKAQDPGAIRKYLMSQAAPNAQFNAMNPADRRDFMVRYEDWWRRTQQTRRGDEVDAARVAGEGASLQRSNLGKALEAIARGNPESAPVAESIGALAEILGDDEAALKALGQFADTYQSKIGQGPAHRKAAVAEGKFAADEENLARKKAAANDAAYRKEMETALAGDPEALEAWRSRGRPTEIRDMAGLTGGVARDGSSLQSAHQRAAAAGRTAADGVGRLADKAGAAASGRSGNLARERLDLAERKLDADLLGKSRKEKIGILTKKVDSLGGQYRSEEYGDEDRREETRLQLEAARLRLDGFMQDGVGPGSSKDDPLDGATTSIQEAQAMANETGRAVYVLPPGRTVPKQVSPSGG